MQIRGVEADFEKNDEVIPRKSSSVLLIRDGVIGLEVFMLKRSEALSFSPGFWVFPGGSVDPSDHNLNTDDDELAAYRLASVRECFEESRLLLAKGDCLSAITSINWPAEVPEGKDFLSWLTSNNLQLDLGALYPLAVWTTPKQAKKRFQTYFFVAEAPADQIGQSDGGETVKAAWVSVSRMVQDIDAGIHQLMFPTEMNCKWLNQYRSVAEVKVALSNHKPPHVTPRMEKREDGIWLNIPMEAGYGISEKFLQK